MSRARGRGGRFSGRGRGGPPGTERIAGIAIPHGDDILLSERPQPTALFPQYNVISPKPLSQDEKIQVARFRSLRDRIHDGPLYTVIGNNVRVEKAATSSNSTAEFNAFEGMATWSQRYIKKRRKLPKLDVRPYILGFFPKELWSTLDPSQAVPRNIEGTVKPKKLLFPPSFEASGLKGFDRELSGEPPEQTNQDTNKDDEVEARGKMDEDDAPMEEDVDDEYEDDEEEMAGDYNAEQYFDDGGDDAGEDYDAGDNGGEYD